MIHDFCILLTKKCNWHCSYCAVDTHNENFKEITKEDISNIIINIPKDVKEICLSGGEPGLASKDIVEYAVEELIKQNKEIYVLTNGEWFKNYSYLNDKISFFVWHVIEEIKPIKVNIPQSLDLSKTECALTVTDDSMKYLDEFMTLNPYINYIIGVDECIVLGKRGPSLSKRNAFEIIKKYKNKLTGDSVNMLLNKCAIQYSRCTYNDI